MEIFIATARSLGEQDIIGVFPTEADAKDAIKTWNPDQIHLTKIYISQTLWGPLLRKVYMSWPR